MIDIVATYWQFLLLGDFPRGPLGGLALTIVLSAICLVSTFPAAVLIALARTSENRPLRYLSTVYVHGIRGIPILLLIFWTYFLIPVVTGIGLSGATTLVIAIVLYQAAYLSEIIRASIEAIPRGQTEACRSLGMSYPLTIWKIILPQALYNAMPGIVSQFTYIIKETSLGYVLLVGEVTYAADQINNMLMTRPLEVFGILAIIYFCVCYSLSRLAGRLEVRVQRRRSGNTEEAAVAYAGVQASR